MTTDELGDLHSIAASVRRIEAVLNEHGSRLDKIERTADRAEGALTLLKWLLGLIGASGMATIIALFSRGGL
jgi:hypothetical protein